MTVCPICKAELVREIKEVYESTAHRMYGTYPAPNEPTIKVVVYKCPNQAPNPRKCIGVGELSEEDYYNLGEIQRRRANR